MGKSTKRPGTLKRAQKVKSMVDLEMKSHPNGHRVTFADACQAIADQWGYSPRTIEGYYYTAAAM